jgi:hypothetical protein
MRRAQAAPLVLVHALVDLLDQRGFLARDLGTEVRRLVHLADIIRTMNRILVSSWLGTGPPDDARWEPSL